eukprot:SAG22_NODE_434_length_10555_cov_3.917559_9_plen_223_part_00
MYWNHEKLGQTKVVSNSLDPQWDAAFNVRIPRWGGLLRVEVFDHDSGSAADYLGQFDMHVGGPEWIEGDIDQLTMERSMFALHPPPAGAARTATQPIQGKVILGIDDPISRRLVVMAADGLKSTDRGGTSDPYAVVFLDGAASNNAMLSPLVLSFRSAACCLPFRGFLSATVPCGFAALTEDHLSCCLALPCLALSSLQTKRSAGRRSSRRRSARSGRRASS